MKLNKIGIIGAGPAGALCAWKLAKAGFEVLLFDHKAPWDKPCAGGLSPYLWDEFPELEPLKELSHPILKIKIIIHNLKEREEFEAELSRPISTVSREKLSGFLIENARAQGVKFFSRKIIELRQNDQGLELKAEASEKTSVDFLIGADGVASMVRRKLCRAWTRLDYNFTFSILTPNRLLKKSFKPSPLRGRGFGRGG